MPPSLATVPDHILLRELEELVAQDQAVEADLLRHLGEVEARQLHLGLGFPSMFSYCTEVLHLSEAIAYHRIQAARAARAYPAIVDRVRSGEIHLSGVKLLAPHLTAANHVELLDQARHKIKRAVVARDQERCAYVSRTGRPCKSRDHLEFHHKHPWARVKDHSVDGIELRCRAHNHYAAVQDFGAEHMARCRAKTRG